MQTASRSVSLAGRAALKPRVHTLLFPSARRQKLVLTLATTNQTPSTMQLYSFPLAFNPQKVLLAHSEKPLKGLQIRNVHLFNGESLQPWYMRISPGSTVPTLTVGEGQTKRTLNQTIDILRFIDEQGDGPLGGKEVDKAQVKELVDALHGWDGNLFAFVNVPAGAKGILGSLGVYRTKVAQAQQARAEAAGDKELAEAYKAKVAAIAATQAEANDTAKVETNRKELGQLLDRAEKLLESNKFLAGPAYSMADVVLTTILFRIASLKQTKDFLGPRPKLSAYYDQVKSRPSFQQTFGPASSTYGQVSWIIPALLKAKFAGLTGRY